MHHKQLPISKAKVSILRRSFFVDSFKKLLYSSFQAPKNVYFFERMQNLILLLKGFNDWVVSIFCKDLQPEGADFGYSNVSPGSSAIVAFGKKNNWFSSLAILDSAFEA